MLHRRALLTVLCIGLLLGGGISIWGQTTTATIAGVVTDETGAVLPGTHVVVKNSDTGLQRGATTDEKGAFLVSELPPGPYEVTVSQTGFETLIRRGITLVVGQRADLPLAMKVGSVAEQVTVTEEAPLVNTSTSTVSGVVEEKRIEELPLNGRDFSQLPLVQPGVAAIRNGDVTVSKGYGARVSMGGSRPDQTAWLLDGTNVRSLTNFGTPGSAAGVMLGVDAVREFQVLTSNYSAEFGGTSGGVINMVSKSGTNQIHGTLYEYLRNSDLDARNFFDIPDKQPFKRNQFGGSLGGAIRKDKAFFFGNYEGLRQRLGLTNAATVPDANAHLGLVPDGKGGLQQLPVAASVRPYLDLWPLPNLGNIVDKNGFTTGIGNLYAPANSSVTEDFFVVRADQHISDKQSLFERFSFDQGTLVSPDVVPITNTHIAVHTRYTTVQHDFVVSPRFLMTTRVAANRTMVASQELPLITYPSSLNLFMPGELPTFSFPGVSTLGPASTNMGGRVQNLYDVQENIQYLQGAHTMKFGVQIDHVGTNINGMASGINGAYTWASLPDFLQDNKLQSFNAAAPGGSTFRSYVQYIYGFYFQDDWKMRPNFTWNLGLRYEPYTAPTEKHDRLSTMKDWLHDTTFNTKISLFQSPGKKDVSPRIGFAWDPRGDGKTAVRAGAGLFFVDLLGPYFLTPGMKNPPFFGSTALVLGNLASSVADMQRIGPALLSPVANPNVLPEIIDWNLNPSYEVKYNFTIERQLPGSLSLSVGYLGDHGIHLWRIGDVNDFMPITLNGRAFVPTQTVRPNPNIGVGTTRHSDAESFYNALQIEVKKRLTRGLQFQSSYTWSKNIDDSTTGVAQTDFTPGGNGASSQPYSPKADRGLSSLNIGQTFVLNGIYDFPAPSSKGFASAALGGWQIASILTANSGAPFTVLISGRNAQDGSRSSGIQHPDLNSSRSFSSIVLGSPNKYFDPQAFFLPPAGYYGDAGRNILIGPGLLNFDFSLHKTTPIPMGEAGKLEFHADFFNLFNRANFANPRAPQQQVLNPANGQYIAGAGQITSTVSNSRQLQFGLKLIF